jgi:rubrerythrin
MSALADAPLLKAKRSAPRLERDVRQRYRLPAPGMELAVTHPAITSELVRPARLTPEHLMGHDVSAGSERYFLWRCETCAYEWVAKVNNRTNGSGCPECNRRPSPGLELTATHPEVAAELVHPVRSTPKHLTARDISAGGRQYFLWRCRTCAHTWEASVGHRARGSGCPECARCLPPLPGAALTHTHPDIAAELVRPARGTPTHLTSRGVSPGSARHFFWRCRSCGREWEASVNSRTSGYGCPECAWRPSPGSELVITHSAIASELMGPARSTPKHLGADSVSAGSGHYFLWRCRSCAQEWEGRVYDRIRGMGCPRCDSSRWTRRRLQYVLGDVWEVVSELQSDERREFFTNRGLLYATNKQRSVVEAVIRNELSDEDIVAYIAGEDTPTVAVILAGHRSDSYGGKDFIRGSLRVRVYDRDGNACLACEAETNLSCDHYPIPESQGGETSLDNLRTLCVACNSISGAKALGIEAIRARRTARAVASIAASPFLPSPDESSQPLQMGAAA